MGIGIGINNDLFGNLIDLINIKIKVKKNVVIGNNLIINKLENDYIIKKIVKQEKMRNVKNVNLENIAKVVMKVIIFQSKKITILNSKNVKKIV